MFNIINALKEIGTQLEEIAKTEAERKNLTLSALLNALASKANMAARLGEMDASHGATQGWAEAAATHVESLGTEFFYGPKEYAAASRTAVANAIRASTVDSGRQAIAMATSTEQSAQLVPKWEGEFKSYEQWVSKGQSWLKSPSHRPPICVDAKGRRCALGADMMRARDEGAFPVRYFWECHAPASLPPVTPAQQDHNAILEEAKTTILWLLRRLRSGYEEPQHVLRAVAAIDGALKSAVQAAPTQQVTLEDALADKDKVPYLIVYDDTDRKPELVIGGTRARFRYKEASAGWNAHLFVKINSNSRDCTMPNATIDGPILPPRPDGWHCPTCLQDVPSAAHDQLKMHEKSA